MSRLPLFSSILFPSLLLSLSAAPALARSPTAEPGAPKEVTFEVVVIAASSEGDEIDPRLTKLSKRLDRTMFTSFKQLAEKTVTLGLSTQAAVALPEGRRLILKPRQLEKSGRLTLFLELEGKTGARLVDLEASLKPGGDFMVGGPKMDDATLLVYLRHLRQKR